VIRNFLPKEDAPSRGLISGREQPKILQRGITDGKKFGAFEAHTKVWSDNRILMTRVWTRRRDPLGELTFKKDWRQGQRYGGRGRIAGSVIES